MTDPDKVKALEERLRNWARGPELAERITAEAADTLVGLQEENERLKDALKDIDAHATPLGDKDGFVEGGYIITTGSLHRALALAGTSVKCRYCDPSQHDCTAVVATLNDHIRNKRDLERLRAAAQAVVDEGCDVSNEWGEHSCAPGACAIDALATTLKENPE